MINVGAIIHGDLFYFIHAGVWTNFGMCPIIFMPILDSTTYKNNIRKNTFVHQAMADQSVQSYTSRACCRWETSQTLGLTPCGLRSLSHLATLLHRLFPFGVSGKNRA